MNKKLHIEHYNRNLREKARKLRNNSTKSEIVLWKHILKAGQLDGYKFNRQKPLLNYIVDFYCKELNLIIEVDGSTHDNQEKIQLDIIRQRNLEKAGFTVIRYYGYDILYNLEFVRSDLLEKIKKLEPPPNPLREGE